MNPDLLVLNGHLATLRADGGRWGVVESGAVAVRAGRIAWVGPAEGLPPEWREGGSLRTGARILDAGGGWVTPGLVDCHTHLVFAGSRVEEFEARLAGATYEELARAGGGILATVRATRDASEDRLFARARDRVVELIRHGVTTVEVKSGYGLTPETELRMLTVARRLGRELPVRVRTTLLAAHALPPEHADDRAGYLDRVVEEMIPEAAERGLADQVDAFCEAIAFTPEECRRVLEAGARHGLGGRLHADQRTDGGGAALAASVGARSADHLEHASEDGVAAMGRAGTAAVLLPGAALFLGDPTVPPVERLRAHGVPLAVATDLNPGSSPLRSPLLALGLACTLFGLTPAEAVAGMTRVAAGVLGLAGEVGTLEVGKRADLAVWTVEHPAELAYWMGGRSCRAVVQGGRVVEVDDLPSGAGELLGPA